MTKWCASSMRSTQPSQPAGTTASPVSSATSRTTASARGSPHSTRPPGHAPQADPCPPAPPDQQQPAVVDDDAADADLGVRPAQGPSSRNVVSSRAVMPGPLVEVLDVAVAGEGEAVQAGAPRRPRPGRGGVDEGLPDPDVASLGLDEDERDAGDRRPVARSAAGRAGARRGRGRRSRPRACRRPDRSAAAAGWLPTEGAAPTPAARARRPVGPPSRRCRRRPGWRASGGRPRPRVGPSPPRDHGRRSWLILDEDRAPRPVGLLVGLDLGQLGGVQAGQAGDDLGGGQLIVRRDGQRRLVAVVSARAPRRGSPARRRPAPRPRARGSPACRRVGGSIRSAGARGALGLRRRPGDGTR